MAPSAADEPPIDVSLGHRMEQRALEIAADKAGATPLRAKVEHLKALRAELMQRREAFHREATARRHARGEIYSRARVAAINEMGPTRQQLEAEARSLYARQPDALGVLVAHARVHFGHALVSSRQLLRYATPDIADAMHAMQRHEEAFAAAWLAAIDDADFTDEMRRSRRSAMLSLRAAARPMHFVSHPPIDGWTDDDALALGKAWNRLEDIAREQGVAPLSQFIVLPDEAHDALPACDELLPTVEALVVAAQLPASRLSPKKATLAALVKLSGALASLRASHGRAGFEVDL